MRRARHLFSERGRSSTTGAEIARSSELTAGALHHRLSFGSQIHRVPFTASDRAGRQAMPLPPGWQPIT
ncbi:TetR family transcriptional regulator [Streptomyces decoyicus]|uniref:TetR family transcriptional regulator n=1 Tax=Streptomyces decoyicus TaxID=249567 RepID=UPI0033AADDFD